MEKAIEIKRRAQRCIQNGDLDGAANEYEKLVVAEDSDPYNYVLLADLLYKKGDHPGASRRYLQAVASYEKATLYKNAIAVCKKMLRLSLSAATVTRHLAQLHHQDGLASEASLYYLQYAEHLVRANEPRDAADALRKAFESSPENIKVLEQLAEAWLLAEDTDKATAVLAEAAQHYRGRGLGVEANRVEARARQMSGAPAQPVNTGEPLSLDTLTLDPGPALPGTIDASGIDLPPIAEVPAPRPLSELMDQRHPAGDSTLAVPAELSAPRLELDEKRTPFPWNGDSVDAPEADADDAVSAAARGQASAESTPEPMATNAIAGLSGAMAPPTWRSDDALVESATPAEPTEAELADAPMAEAEAVYEICETDLQDEPVRPAAPVSVSSAHLRVPSTLAEVEKRLHAAQDCFNAGERERATGLLVEAAQAYESLGRLDNAATIYRSLGRNTQTPVQALKLWLANCEKRADLAEAAQVACELGDRAINEDDTTRAREWFDRARMFDPANELARRRLQRLDEGRPSAVAERPLAGGVEPGRVEVALGRADAVTFDLGSLLSEFQRGVEAQLSGDAQSHYDLGVTYREMGLLEQAVDAFRVSEQTPALAARSLEMIGRCLVDQGRPAEAAIEFERAVGSLGDQTDHVGELLQQLGMAHELAGDTPAAIEVYERIDPGSAPHEEIAARLSRLRGEAA